MSAPLTFEQLQRRLTQKLSAVHNDMAALEARLILQLADNCSQTELALKATAPVSAKVQSDCEGFLARRLRGEPMAQIIGTKEFFGRDFIVNKNVLDPRPDSEILVAAALAQIPAEADFHLLDLGVGSGALILSVLGERPHAKGLGVDISRPALAVARRNAHRLGLRHRVALRQGNWFANMEGRFDMIIANPPYIAADEMRTLPREVISFDPHRALYGGTDGLEPYRIITAQAHDYLTDGGWLLFEIGPTQAAAVSKMLGFFGFQNIETRQDLAKRDRVVMGQKSVPINIAKPAGKKTEKGV